MIISTIEISCNHVFDALFGIQEKCIVFYLWLLTFIGNHKKNPGFSRNHEVHSQITSLTPMENPPEKRFLVDLSSLGSGVSFTPGGQWK